LQSRDIVPSFLSRSMCACNEAVRGLSEWSESGRWTTVLFAGAFYFMSTVLVRHDVASSQGRGLGGGLLVHLSS
jgi:hypothetical protein